MQTANFQQIVVLCGGLAMHKRERNERKNNENGFYIIYLLLIK